VKLAYLQVSVSRFNHLLAFGGLIWVIDWRAPLALCGRLPRILGNRFGLGISHSRSAPDLDRRQKIKKYTNLPPHPISLLLHEVASSQMFLT
jgi:hypothetical protein